MIKKILIMEIIFLLIIVIISNVIFNKLKQEDVKYQKYLNTEIVISGNTLKIVDYNKYTEIYILDDGSKVSYYFVVNIKNNE